MSEKQKALLGLIQDVMIFASLTFAMMYVRDLTQVVQYGFLLVAMTIINKK